MITSLAFRKTSVISLDPSFSLWSAPYEPSNEYYMEALLTRLVFELNAVWESEELLLQKGTAIISDLLVLGENAESLEKDNLHFLQFHTSAIIMENVISRKMFFYGFDWICNSLSNKVYEPPMCETDYGRIHSFIISKSAFIRDNIDEALALWTSNLFYYARCTGGHNSLAKNFLEEYFKFLKYSSVGTENDRFIASICQINAWSERHHDTFWIKKSSELLSKLYQNQVFTRSQKKIIAFQFSCIKKNYTTESRSFWLNELQTTYVDLLTPTERVQVFMNRYQGDLEALINNIKELAQLTKALKDSIQMLNLGRTQRNYEENRCFTLYLNALHTLIMNGRHSEANQVIRFFMGFDKVIELNNIFVVPNSERGTIYCSKGGVISTETNPHEILDIIKSGNEFLGTTHVLDDQLDFEVQVPDRYGIPDPKKADRYLSAIKKHLLPEKILLVPHLQHYASFYMIYGQLLPLQSILASEQGITLSVEQSFCEVEQQRPVKEVVIWQGDTLTSEIECKSVSEIFQSRGISTKVIDCNQVVKAEFWEEYNNPSYDLVWLASHGEFQHFEPHKSNLPLAENLIVELDEFHTHEINCEGRRLIVLNVCNGSNISLFNGPGIIGFSGSLVSAKQSVISHLWPVDFIASMVYGLVLATFLADGESYAISYRSTVTTYREGKESVLERLKEYIKSEDILEMIQNKEMDYENFFYWGSMSFAT